MIPPLILTAALNTRVLPSTKTHFNPCLQACRKRFFFLKLSYNQWIVLNSTYCAVRDPLLMAVLLCSPELLGQLGAINIRVQLSYRAQHNHLRETNINIFEQLYFFFIFFPIWEENTSHSWNRHKCVFAQETQSARTGTFILNSSLLNLKRMSESVRCRRVVGLRTRTSWRFPGKEPWHRKGDRVCSKASKSSHFSCTCSVFFFFCFPADSMDFSYITPPLCLSFHLPRDNTDVKKLVDYQRMKKMWRVQGAIACQGH